MYKERKFGELPQVSEINDGSKATLKEKIVELAAEHWNREGNALLLASLGQTLTKYGYNLRAELRGQKLVPFLQAELEDKVTVLTSPDDPLVYGIVPVGQEKSRDLGALFSRTARVVPERINFDKRVWVAFSRPIEPNHIRLVDFEPEIDFRDLPAESAKNQERPTIPAELIIPVGTKPSAVRNAEIQKNIRDWFAKHALDIELAKEKGGIDKRILDNSLLTALLVTLDKKDLERIVLPLDIVAKLLGQKAGR